MKTVDRVLREANDNNPAQRRENAMMAQANVKLLEKLRSEFDRLSRESNKRYRDIKLPYDMGVREGLNSAMNELDQMISDLTQKLKM